MPRFLTRRCLGLLGTGAFAASLGAGACQGGSKVEAGALLLVVSTAASTPAPDELRVSVHDDSGALWRDVRVPESGAFVPESGARLGTIFIQPGVTAGSLRILVRGLRAGVRVADGTLTVPAADRARGTFEVVLAATPLPDGDGDGIPDVVDDSNGAADAGVDAASDAAADAAADATTDAGRDGGSDGPGSDVVADAGGGCDAAAGCRKPRGAACSGDVECATEYCVDGVCCDTACIGTCRSCNQSTRNGTCAGLAQGTDPDRECSSGQTCNGIGTCGSVPATGQKRRGELCGAAGECESGDCVDGVCCNNACGGVCRTCETGSCTDVRRRPDPPECAAPMTCNDSGRCVAQ